MRSVAPATALARPCPAIASTAASCLRLLVLALPTRWFPVLLNSTDAIGLRCLHDLPPPPSRRAAAGSSAASMTSTTQDTSPSPLHATLHAQDLSLSSTEGRTTRTKEPVVRRCGQPYKDGTKDATARRSLSNSLIHLPIGFHRSENGERLSDTC